MTVVHNSVYDLNKALYCWCGCNKTHTVHVWYIYLHLPLRSTKCREIYQSHGSYGKWSPWVFEKLVGACWTMIGWASRLGFSVAMPRFDLGTFWYTFVFFQVIFYGFYPGKSPSFTTIWFRIHLTVSKHGTSKFKCMTHPETQSSLSWKFMEWWHFLLGVPAYFRWRAMSFMECQCHRIGGFLAHLRLALFP